MARYDGLYVLPWSADLLTLWERQGKNPTLLLESYGPVFPDTRTGKPIEFAFPHSPKALSASANHQGAA